MLNKIYRLTDVRKIMCFQRELNIDDRVVIKPTYLAICQADQRYFNGRRSKKVMQQKLPMALIHEGVGKVLLDKTGEFKKGDRVVILPNIENERESDIKGNYRQNSVFMSSGTDGFMQDLMAVKKENIVKIEDNSADYSVYAMSEILSVAYNAINTFKERAKDNNFKSVGIWGDGAIAYVVALVIKNEYPDVEINLFGKHIRKMQMFSFVDKTIEISEIDEDMQLDHCFECVGGQASEEAINQIIKVIKPQGIISLLGVSEYNVSINTRSVLDKGLVLLGNSRSDRNDFQNAVDLIKNDEYTRYYLEKIIMKKVEVKSINDMINAFEQDMINDYKTVLKWEV